MNNIICAILLIFSFSVFADQALFFQMEGGQITTENTYNNKVWNTVNLQ